LDGLRGLAILMVFFFHYGDLSNSPSQVLRLIALVKGAGWVGVDLFFVLSGFLITGILLDTRRDSHYFRNFYMRRMLRLFPVFYGTAAVLLLVTPLFHIHWRPAQAWYLFYGANFLQLYDFSLSFARPFTLMHIWSLALEEQFYFVWPLLIYFVANRPKLLKITLGILVAAPLLRILLVQMSVPPLAIYCLLPTRMDGFAVGGGLAVLMRDTDMAALARRCRILFPVCLAIIAGLVVARGTSKFTDSWMIQIGYSTLAFLFASLVTLSLQPAGMVHRIFSWSVLRFYGRISYGFYVYHELIHDLTKPIYYTYIRHLRNNTVAGALYTFSVLVLITILSVLSYQFFELPFLRLKSKFQSSRTKTQLANVAVSATETA